MGFVDLNLGAGIHKTALIAGAGYQFTGIDLGAATGPFDDTPPIPWTPLDSGILAAWYDPSDDANLILSGSEIIGAVDLSGNGRTAGIAGTGTLTRGTLNGVQSFFHNGENRALSIDSFAASGGYMFVQQSTADAAFIVMAPGNNTTQYDLICAEGNSSTTTSAGVTRSTLYANGVAVSATPTRGQLYTALTGDCIGYAQTALPGSWAGKISPYGYNNLTSYSLTGNVGGLFFFTSVPTTDMRQKFEGYSAHKWGMTAELDVSHPYKSAVPYL